MTRIGPFSYEKTIEDLEKVLWSLTRVHDAYNEACWGLCHCLGLVLQLRNCRFS